MPCLISAIGGLPELARSTRFRTSEGESDGREGRRLLRLGWVEDPTPFEGAEFDIADSGSDFVLAGMRRLNTRNKTSDLDQYVLDVEY